MSVYITKNFSSWKKILSKKTQTSNKVVTSEGIWRVSVLNKHWRTRFFSVQVSNACNALEGKYLLPCAMKNAGLKDLNHSKQPTSHWKWQCCQETTKPCTKHSMRQKDVQSMPCELWLSHYACYNALTWPCKTRTKGMCDFHVSKHSVMLLCANA